MNNTIHETIVNYVRQQLNQRGGDLAARLSDLTDEAFMRRMFASYRGDKYDRRGLMLSNFGLQIMNMFFRGCEIPMPDGEKLQPKHLVYLDQHSRYPYHASVQGFVIFDTLFATKLKLAGGQISIMMDIEA